MTLRGIGSRLRGCRIGARAVVTALAIVGLMAIAGPAAASSGGVAAASEVTAPVEEIGPLSASGCTGRNGPGDINQTCIHVYGSGTHVRQIRGSMRSTNLDFTPITLCGVKVHVWGTLSNGARYDHVGTAACSFYGSAFVNWYPDTHFRDGTSICARTEFKAQWSSPACVQIRR